MPLLGRQPFQRQKLKLNTQLIDKQYFYCKHTQEIFLDYESLFQRVIQCNSLVWTCSLTARPGLTFQEAVESEKKARSILATFPEPLKQPVLYIATLTNRNRIGDLCDDVYNYIRDRFFVGEKVEYILEGDRKICEVTAVNPPGKHSRSPKKSGSPSKEAVSDPGKQQYELCETDDAEEIQICRVVDGKDLSRLKGTYTKTTNKLFIKQHVTLKEGSLVVKDSSAKKYELDSPSLKAITGNKKPDFINLAKTNSPKSKNGQMDITKAFAPKNGAKKSGAKVALSPEEVKQKFEEQRMRKMQQREKEKEQMREEKLLIAKFKMEWNKPRDDLECDDLKDLPVPTKIKCNIPDEVVGDSLMILEFVHQFGSLLKAKRTYPHGLSFELLEKALYNSDIDGPLNDLLQMFLLAILNQQEEEGEEQVGVKEPGKKIDQEALEDDMEDLTTTKALLAAKIAATWPQYFHGTILRKMPLDTFTLTEMLRLHLTASGSEVFPRVFERGMYVSQENPGLYFKIENPEIMKLLATSSVFQFDAAQRVKLINVLMAQLLTYESYRDHVEESAKSLKNAMYALKQLRWARSRRGKEEKNKKKPDKGENNAEEKPSSPKIELSPEEKAKEDAKFLEQSLKKEKELVTQIEKLQGVSALHPIGLDRAYRRYWVFKSVPGIFVEDNDPFVGLCQMSPTPSQPASTFAVKTQDELPLSFMRKYLNSRKKENDKNGQSDKENESSDASSQSSNLNHSKPQKLLSDANPRINSPLKVNQRHSSSASSDGADDKDSIKKDFGVCTADPISCPVHGTRSSKSKVLWSFFHTEEELDNLIASLNVRGHRESALKDALIKDKIAMINSVSACPVDKLNSDTVKEEAVVEVRKSNRKVSVFHNIPPEEALISTFRDALLENEEKLWAGSLGYVKVNDRKLWREAINDGRYDMQTDYIKWGHNGKRLNGESVDKMDVDDEKMRSTSPSLVASPVIVDMASALLQVAQGVEPKYIVPPLADDDKFKKQKQKQIEKQEKSKIKVEATNQDEVGESQLKGSAKSPFQRWEESLMTSTSISQLFIHLATLERSITWRKAAKNASCRICRKKADPEKMLLCDGCDKGYHMYCLKPPLNAVPSGDWFCPPCEPPAPKETRRNAKSYKELSDSEGEEEEEEEGDEAEEEEDEAEGEEVEDEEAEDEEEVEVQDDDDEEEDDDEVEVDTTQNVDDEEEEEEEEDDEEINLDESDEDEEDAVSSGVDETDFCVKCKTGGDLLECDSCPATWHLKCCNPPLKRVPRGKWICGQCIEAQEIQNKKEQNEKEKTLKSSSGKRRANSPLVKNNESDKKEKENERREKEKASKSSSTSKRRASSPLSKKDEADSSGSSQTSSRSNRRSSNEKRGLPLDYNSCSKILTLLSQHQHSWPFMRAVTKKEAPDYHKIIKRPVDLGLLRSRLNNQTYLTNSQFTADVYLMFQNCEVYNGAHTQQYQSGKGLARYFQSLLRQYKLADSSDDVPKENGHDEVSVKRARH